MILLPDGAAEHICRLFPFHPTPNAQVAFIHKTDESILGRLLVEMVILLSAHSVNDSGKSLTEAADLYKVNVAAITAKVKQGFAAKDKAKATKKVAPNPPAKALSPYAPLPPELRWFPAAEHLRDTAYEKLLPPLLAKVREGVATWRASGYAGASSTSRALLTWWFETDHLM